MNIDLIINFRIAQTRSVYVVLKMSQQLTFSCIVIFTFLYEPIRDKLKEVVNNLQELSDQNVTEIQLYSSPNIKGNQNLQILKSTIKYIMDSKRFTCSLIMNMIFLLCFINPLIFLLQSINNAEKIYSLKKHFSSSSICF